MLTTNREFDSKKFLKALGDKTGFNPGGAEADNIDVEVNYVVQGVVNVEITLTIELTEEEADTLLFDSK